MVQNESISKTYAQKKYLKWSDQEILANRAFLKKDKELEFELAQIIAMGPNWRQLTTAGGEVVEGQPMGAGAGGAIPTGVGGAAGMESSPSAAGAAGSEAPPAFGPPPTQGTPPTPPEGGTPQAQAPTA
jgi:hypothetical protein